MENTEWLKEIVNSYNNINEECVECNESVEENKTEWEESEQVEELESIEEDTSDEDFMCTLWEDVQAAVGEELT